MLHRYFKEIKCFKLLSNINGDIHPQCSTTTKHCVILTTNLKFVEQQNHCVFKLINCCTLKIKLLNKKHQCLKITQFVLVRKTTTARQHLYKYNKMGVH